MTVYWFSLIMDMEENVGIHKICKFVFHRQHIPFHHMGLSQDYCIWHQSCSGLHCNTVVEAGKEARGYIHTVCRWRFHRLHNPGLCEDLLLDSDIVYQCCSFLHYNMKLRGLMVELVLLPLCARGVFCS